MPRNRPADEAGATKEEEENVEEREREREREEVYDINTMMLSR